MSMLLAAIRKEMQLLGRDLHGLAVLFAMPIVFMLIMSVALSRDEDPHEGAHIVLAGDAGNPLNASLATALEKRGMKVQTEAVALADPAGGAPLGPLTQRLQAGEISLILHNPNATPGTLKDEKALQLLVRPGTERAWLTGIDGVVREEYTQLRIARLQADSGAGNMTSESDDAAEPEKAGHGSGTADDPAAAGTAAAAQRNADDALAAPRNARDAAQRQQGEARLSPAQRRRLEAGRRQQEMQRQQEQKIGQAVQEGVRNGLSRELAEIGNYLKQPRTETRHTAAGKQVGKPSSVQHSVPAWLIFGMFFILIPLSNVMAMERQTNTLTRLRMAQAPASLLLLSKLLPYFLINQLQFAGMVLLGKHLLPHLGIASFSLTGPLWPWLLLSSATSLAALGYGLLVAVQAKSTEHAVVLGGGGIIIMAALGGIMVPVHVMPEAMQTVSLVSPMGWSLRAFHALLLDHASFAQIGHFVGALAVAGLVCLALASFFHHRQLKTLARF